MASLKKRRHEQRQRSQIMGVLNRAGSDARAWAQRLGFLTSQGWDYARTH